jgi:DNA-binding SARP family transcriptional activator
VRGVLGEPRVKIVGDIRVLDANGLSCGPGGSMLAAVLALLVGSLRRTVTHDALIEDLWDGLPPPSAAAAARVHVHALRKVLEAAGLGGTLVTRGSGYQLDLDDDAVDVTRAARLVRQAQESQRRGFYAVAKELASTARELLAGKPMTNGGGRLSLLALAHRCYQLGASAHCPPPRARDRR